MKLNYRRTFFVGLAFLSICAFWQMYDNVIPLILKNTFHLGETWTGVVMAMDNVLALMLLPLFGMLSDKLRTPLGRRTPFILVGTVLAVVCMILLPVTDNAGSLTGFFIALAIFEIVHGSSPQLTIANINFLSASEHLSYRTLKKPLSNTLKNEATLSFTS